MSRIVYVNGEYVPEEEAKISVFDRGFLFSDGVYEVSSVLRGRLIDNPAHLARLHRSLAALEMGSPVSDQQIQAIQQTLIERNRLDEGLVYLQITRGAADRDFAYPAGVTPTLVMFTQAKSILDNPLTEKGITVITTEDIRWRRRDIKAVGLLAPCIAKMAAKKAGADDAWMVEGGLITEGTSNNAYIITTDGTLVTRQLSADILSGVTRSALLQIAREDGLKVEERPFTPQEAYAAAEAFISSATTFVLPVTAIDQHRIGDGRPGAVSQRLRRRYIETVLAQVESS